ncbi:MAG TPA: DNA recombination protein RmuC [bacterium]|nr:DNA recombination protein RmuC [bacterium]
MQVFIIANLVLSMALLVLFFLGRKGGSDPQGRELEKGLGSLARDLERLEKVLKDEMARGREETGNRERAARDEMGQQFQNIVRVNEEKLESIRLTLERLLNGLQEENAKKLDEMRMVVDEKLQSTLEKRLTESFRQVSDRLERVHQGLGEMQSLASSVGDLKAVLTNVKTRGTWGEVQLEALLSQVLSPAQYAKNVQTKKDSGDRVEFAIRLPGRGEQDDEVLLPIDAKFPVEDHQRLMAALEKGDGAQAEEMAKNLVNRLKSEARAIKEKYLDPPATTDFGILFLPTEGLYAEVLRQPGLVEELQRDHRIVVTGPTTLTAILNSLQLGFRTLAIEKRTSEVWALLGTVKKEFGLFAGILEKTQKKLQEASHTIEDAAKKTRTIERKLKGVEGIQGNGSEALEEEPAQGN